MAYRLGFYASLKANLLINRMKNIPNIKRKGAKNKRTKEWVLDGEWSLCHYSFKFQNSIDIQWL